MSDSRRIDERESMQRDAHPGAARRPYESPRLVRYGDIRDVTLGPSPGGGESANPGLLKA